MQILQTHIFKRAAERLRINPPLYRSFKKMLQTLQKNPEMGSLSKGDLENIRIHRVTVSPYLISLAYYYDRTTKQLTFLALISSHSSE